MIELTPLVVEVVGIILTTIFGIIGYFILRLINQNDKRHEEQQIFEREVRNQLAVLSSAVVELQKAEMERKEKDKEQREQIMLILEAQCASLRDRIVQSCRHFISVGKIPAFERENISRMYHAYHALGGNDIASDFFNAVMELDLEI